MVPTAEWWQWIRVTPSWVRACGESLRDHKDFIASTRQTEREQAQRATRSKRGILQYIADECATKPKNNAQSTPKPAQNPINNFPVAFII